MANDNKKKTPAMDDVLFHQKPDRRLLSYAPDVTGHRTNRDRRGRDSANPDTGDGYIKLQQDDKNGQRYLVGGRGPPPARAVVVRSVGSNISRPGQTAHGHFSGPDIHAAGIGGGEIENGIRNG